MPPSVRILFVTPVSPFSAASGAEQRSALLFQALKALGTVDVLQLVPGEHTKARRADVAGVDLVLGEVRGGNGLLRYRPKRELTAALEVALGKTLGSYDLIVGRYLWSLCQVVLPGSVPTLVDLDDFRYRYGGQAAWSLALIKERLVKAVNYQLARRQLHRFDAAFIVSERDRSLLGNMACTLLSNVPWSIPSQVAAVAQGQQVLFVGSLWYRPNADGVDWFLAKVWPMVRADVPKATLRLVGPAPPSRRAGWERHPGVSAPGFVDDLGAAYAAASVVVVPVHSGGGSNIKVLEALAHGRACVVSSLALDAFHPTLTNRIQLIGANDAIKFAAAVTQLLQEPPVACQLGQAGRASVLSHFVPKLFWSQAEGGAAKCMAATPSTCGASEQENSSAND